MKRFLSSNKWEYRLLRTIVQGIIGVIIANLDVLIGLTDIPVTVKPMMVALVMAVLSPVMAALGESDDTPVIGDDCVSIPFEDGDDDE